MNQRSKIRQCALHYIYAKTQGGQTVFAEDLFWDIALEKEREHYHRSFAKMLAHTARNSQDSFRLLEERLNALIDATAEDMTTSSLRDELSRFLTQSSKLEASIIALGHALVDKRREDCEPLVALSSELIATADVLKHLGPDLSFMLADYPTYARYAEGVKAIIKRRLVIGERIVAMRDVDLLPADGEYKALIKASKDLASIRPAAEELAQNVLSQQERWEEIIEPLLKNYSMQRLDLLDKCILFLMLYELKMLELPLPVVVSEANALANAYSGSKSATFIHGVLAAAHKTEPTS
ncbi:MAG: transcription antitermination factor NusB [Akkermansia sp.]